MPTSRCGRQSSWLTSPPDHLVRLEGNGRGHREANGLGSLEVDRSFTPGNSPSRKDAHEAPGRDGQEGFKSLDREASRGGAGLVELELHAAARRLHEGEARGQNDLPRSAHTIRGAERGEPAAVSPVTEGEDGREEGLA